MWTFPSAVQIVISLLRGEGSVHCEVAGVRVVTGIVPEGLRADLSVSMLGAYSKEASHPGSVRVNMRCRCPWCPGNNIGGPLTTFFKIGGIRSKLRHIG